MSESWGISIIVVNLQLRVLPAGADRQRSQPESSILRLCESSDNPATDSRRPRRRLDP